jgi:hypothetical protein
MATGKNTSESNTVKRLAAIGITLGIITGGAVPGWKYADGCIDNKIKKVVKVELSTELRDMRVPVEFNRMQAEKDSLMKKDWNKAIDLIDNSGTVR